MLKVDHSSPYFSYSLQRFSLLKIGNTENPVFAMCFPTRLPDLKSIIHPLIRYVSIFSNSIPLRNFSFPIPRQSLTSQQDGLLSPGKYSAQISHTRRRRSSVTIMESEKIMPPRKADFRQIIARIVYHLDFITLDFAITKNKDRSGFAPQTTKLKSSRFALPGSRPLRVPHTAHHPA